VKRRSPLSLVSIPRSVTLGTRCSRDVELVSKIEGFVTEIAAGLAERRPLREVVLAAAASHPQGATAFHVDEATLLDTFALTDEHTFANDLSYELSITNRERGEELCLEIDADSGDELRTLLGMCGSGTFTAKETRAAVSDEVAQLFDELVELGMVTTTTEAAQSWIAGPGVPGVTRLQHASILYRGRSACVVVDPHVQSAYEPDEVTDSVLHRELVDRVDAIVISHSHGDHFHLPTLMTFAASTPIIVPKVDRPTMLCPSFAEVLRMLGFTRVIQLGWNDPPFVVGDLEIHALPFFGEQPLVREPPRHPDLRNHGNTYVVRCSDYTSWFLIDSGNDVTGRMEDVAHDVVRRFGPIDILLSNLRQFNMVHPRYIMGNYAYWMALTPDQMTRFAAMSGECLTLGPSGVADVCAIAKAGHYLPYAHWFGNLGAPPADQEAVLLQTLEDALRRTRAETRIVPWQIGDTYVAGRSAEHAVLPFSGR
jgi:L-ascorbate metabolism protein UlaG (beta-lactamase superfamily)